MDSLGFLLNEQEENNLEFLSVLKVSSGDLMILETTSMRLRFLITDAFDSKRQNTNRHWIKGILIPGQNLPYWIKDWFRNMDMEPDGSFILPWEAFAFKTTLKIVKDGKTWQADFTEAFVQTHLMD